MDVLVGSATALVAAHPVLAVLVAFGGAVMEAGAVLGMVIPGTPILMAVAGIAALAGLSMTPIVLTAVVGAVLGDGILFWLGARYRERISTAWPFSRFPGLLASAARFFACYGVLSVTRARFVPGLRSTVPVVAGMAGMARARFLTANIASAIV